MTERKSMDNKQRISPTMIQLLVRAHWNAMPKEAVHFVGEPSTWKSVLVREEAMQIAQDNEREFVDWNAVGAQRKAELAKDASKAFIFADVRALETDVGDLRLQDLNSGDGHMRFMYNALFVAMAQEHSAGVLFLDELNNAPSLQKMQMYKLINDRAIGDLKLSDNILVVSAGNEAEHSYGTTDDPVPLVLRRANYFVAPPTSEEYLAYAVLANVHPWVTGYLAFAPQNTHKIDYSNPDPVGQPCTRTWSKLSGVLQANPKLPQDVVGVVAKGYVGQAVGTEFAAYVQMARRINIDDVLANPAIIKEFDPTKELSLLYAVVTGVVERYRTDKKVVGAALEVSLQIREELGVYMLRQMRALDHDKFMKQVVVHEKFKEFAEKYGKYL